jgi:hypothetical protein
VPDVTIDYYARNSIRKVALMHYQYGYFKPLAAQKAGRVGTVRQLVPAAFLLSLLVTSVLTPWVELARWILVALVSTYLVLLFFSAARNISQNGIRVSALLAVVFPTIHFSYAFGSVRGLINIFVRAAFGGKRIAEVRLSR